MIADKDCRAKPGLITTNLSLYWESQRVRVCSGGVYLWMVCEVRNGNIVSEYLERGA